MSDGGFFTFLRGRRGALFAAVLLLLGAVLLLFGRTEGNVSDTDITDEERLAAFCSSIEGVGECRVYITYTPASRVSSESRVEGVAIVCRGASSLSVRAELTELISSLSGLGTNRISVAKLND